MKKKLLVLLIAIIPSFMPNLASAVAIDVEDCWICGILCAAGVPNCTDPAIAN